MKKLKLYRGTKQIGDDALIDAQSSDYDFLCARKDDKGCRVGRDSYCICYHNVTEEGEIPIIRPYYMHKDAILGFTVDGGELEAVVQGSDGYCKKSMSVGEHVVKIYFKHTLNRLEGAFNPLKTMTKFDGSHLCTKNVTNLKGMFTNCSNMEECIGIRDWDTSKVYDMRDVFNNCATLTSVDVAKWDTSILTTSSGMFNGCSSLTEVNVSNWDMSNNTSISYMFSKCMSLTVLDVSKWNTSKVTAMNATFYDCEKLETIDVSKWDTSTCTNFESTFDTCSALTTLDVSNWDVSNGTNFKNTFSKCQVLPKLDVSKWDVSNGTNFHTTFNACKALTFIDVENWNTSQATDMSGMFINCNKLEYVDISKWNTSNLQKCGSMFRNDWHLNNLKFTNWDTSKLTEMGYMFQSCSMISSDMDLSMFNCKSIVKGSGVSANINIMFEYNTYTVLKLSDKFFDFDDDTLTEVNPKFSVNWSHDSMMESLYENQKTRDKSKVITIKLTHWCYDRLSAEEVALIATNGLILERTDKN